MGRKARASVSQDNPVGIAVEPGELDLNDTATPTTALGRGAIAELPQDEDDAGIPPATAADGQREVGFTVSSEEAPSGNGTDRTRKSQYMLMGTDRDSGLPVVVFQGRSKRAIRKQATPFLLALRRMYDDLHIAVVKREEL
jgi:hypothetical protein